MRELTMLGTGCAMVTNCYNTCFLVKFDNGNLWLTDAGGGNGILRQLKLAGTDYGKLHHMFVTHGHTDHVLGVIWVIRQIAELMNKGQYAGKFYIYCHDEVKKLLTTMVELMLKKKDAAHLGKDILLCEATDGEEFDLSELEPGLKFTAFDILSTKAKQFGYELKFTDGLRLCCLGDEPYNEHTEKYAKGADWLLSEAFCLYRDRDIFKPYEKNHSTVKEAGEIAAALGVKNLLLYHTEDKNIGERKLNYTAEAKEYFGGNIFVPDDLEIIKLD